MALTYEPLDVDSYQIRILRILPDPPESDVRCTMETTSLLDPIAYTALSYCWGNANITTDIYVNGVKTPVTTNLADALQQLRKIGVDTLWADALCINQKDNIEKGLQIRNMMEVYSRADRTYGWLGHESDDGTTAAIVFLQSLLKSHGEMSNESHFQGLRHLLQREYWRRRWIIQEISVPYEVIILCGDAAMVLDEMIVAINKCRESSYWNSDLDDVYPCFQSIENFRRLFQAGTKPLLGKAITLTRHFLSSQPSDAIFSLLGLSHDGSGLVPTPNYLQPTEVVLANLTFALIRRYKHLDYILINS